MRNKHNLICPGCGGDKVFKATRAQRKTLAGAGPWDNIRACAGCGRVFEAPWPSWTVWFCMICGWLSLVMGALVVVSVLFEGNDAGDALKVTPVMLVPLFILPAAYRQRRLRRRGTGGAATPPSGQQ